MADGEKEIYAEKNWDSRMLGKTKSVLLILCVSVVVIVLLPEACSLFYISVFDVNL
jgi:hypothetical protein